MSTPSLGSDLEAIEKKWRERANVPARQFTWIDRYKERHRLCDMETKYVFNVVCMIWNHAMPEEAWTRQDHFRYYFTSRPFSKEYMAQAIREMLPELLWHRQDVTPYQRETLDKMYQYLTRNREKLGEFQLRIGHDRTL